MTYEEFQRHIGKAGLKLYEFAHLMGMNPISISNKRRQGVPTHLAVIAVLLGEMAERGIDFRELLARNDICHPEQRASAEDGVDEDSLG
ncbi:XRE family transcriptional regulator [Massilia timonae]|uniref:XRE family transcriptional regulator n=1 Tax=Massilia timonae TaxID=47229 RepID=UPI0028AA2983|nr:XRE family transcriptional regulator [Massilia timonae]